MEKNNLGNDMDFDLTILPVKTNREGTTLRHKIHPNLPDIERGSVLLLIMRRGEGKGTLINNLLLNPNFLNESLMYFSNSRWDSDWGGQFEYIDRSGNSHKIDYVPGRIILFPAVLKHRADCPQKQYIYRLSTVFRIIMSIEWVYNNQDPEIHQKT